ILGKPPSVIIVRLANQHHYTSGGFLLEAEAHWGHTCIAGGLFGPYTNHYHQLSWWFALRL
ncbi:MAG: hypothetical protein J5643_01770, partial [Lachnospiraceae bacterium]|nr:hypothetical protein [Lachnospiraceae bacterium]